MASDIQKLARINAAIANIVAEPGPLAARPRQVESFVKLNNRQNDETLSIEQKFLAGFDITGGVGKTVMFGRAVSAFRKQGLRVLVVAPKIDLVNQAGGKFSVHFGDDAEGTIIHGRAKHKIGADVDLSDHNLLLLTDRSLLNRYRAGQINPADWDVVIYDEAQMLINEETENHKLFKLLAEYGLVMAFTATSEHSNGRSLAKHFGMPVDTILLPEAVEGNLLSSIKTSIIHTRTKIGFENLGDGAEFDPVKMAAAINQAARNQKAVQTYASFADPETGYRMLGERGFAYCGGVDHARHMAQLFNQQLTPVLPAELLANADYLLLSLADINDDLKRSDYDQVQAAYLRDVLARHRARERTVPILPAALVHGEMKGWQIELVHEAFDRDLIKIVPNDDIWTTGIDTCCWSFTSR